MEPDRRTGSDAEPPNSNARESGSESIGNGSAGGDGDSDGRPSRWTINDGSPGGAGAVAGVGIQFAVSILLFLYVGQWLDRRFGWTPWGTLVGVLVGAVAGFTSLYRRLMAELRREEAGKRK